MYKIVALFALFSAAFAYPEPEGLVPNSHSTTLSTSPAGTQYTTYTTTCSENGTSVVHTHSAPITPSAPTTTSTFHVGTSGSWTHSRSISSHPSGFTSSQSGHPHLTGSWPNSSPPAWPTSTETLTTYTSTTVCPLTRTSGNVTETTWTTSTVTVTSCKGGCTPTSLVHPSTAEYTTYTTVTTCPVTHTSGGVTRTSLTTSTITVTSCKGGCTRTQSVGPTSHHHSQSTPASPTGERSTTRWIPGTTSSVITEVTTYPVTEVKTSWVPCSSPVGTSSGNVYYSTSLTSTYYTTTYYTTETTSYTGYPSPTSSMVPFTPPAVPLTSGSSVSPVQASTCVPQIIYVTAGTSSGTCRPCTPEQTITVTVTHDVVPSSPAGESMTTEIATVTLSNGKTTTVFVTYPHETWPIHTETAPPYPTHTVSSSAPHSTGGWHSGSSAPHSTGGWHRSSSSPHPTASSGSSSTSSVSGGSSWSWGAAPTGQGWSYGKHLGNDW